MNLTNAVIVCRAEKINLKTLRYRYPTRTPLTLQAELRQIEKCIAKGYPRLFIEPIKEEWLSIVGYGPSLRETWSQITHPCITVSGAHDFLLERGMVPDYHAECDGRDHKTKHLEKPTRATWYLMASVCNPLMWEQLEGCKVRIWHTAGGEHVVKWIGENDDGGLLVAGGSVIGLTAIHLGGILGYRKFRVFGMDGNFHGEARHAGPHYGPAQKIIEHEVNGKIWRTTPQMVNASEEFMFLMKDENLRFEVIGDSMLNDMKEKSW